MTKQKLPIDQKWYRVEYFTTLEPPKKVSEVDRYEPKGAGKPFLVSDMRVFDIEKEKPHSIDSKEIIKKLRKIIKDNTCSDGQGYGFEGEEEVVELFKKFIKI